MHVCAKRTQVVIRILTAEIERMRMMCIIWSVWFGRILEAWIWRRDKPLAVTTDFRLKAALFRASVDALPFPFLSGGPHENPWTYRGPRQRCRP